MVSNTQRLGWLYTTGRIACFLGVATVLWPLHLRPIITLLLALLLSAPLSFVLLRKVRMAWGAQLEQGFAHRKAEKARLRAALRGDDDSPLRGGADSPLRGGADAPLRGGDDSLPAGE